MVPSFHIFAEAGLACLRERLVEPLLKLAGRVVTALLQEAVARRHLDQ